LRRATIELPLAADRADPTPLAGQIAGQLRAAMADGRLAAGERLPASRELSVLLGVSRTVVTGAYAQLFAEGWIEGRQGSGTYVAEGTGGAPPDERDGAARTSRGGSGHPDGSPAANGAGAGAAAGAAGGLNVVGGLGAGAAVGAQDGASPGTPWVELRPGITWTAGIDRAAWRRAWRSVGSQPPAAAADRSGLPELRGALTSYLRRSRGVHCPPGQILVTRGVAGSLRLIAAAMLRPGDAVGVEEPGYPAARAVFAAHGARVIPCRADADGLVVDELPAGLKLVYTTPAHQYPLGGRLPVPRRQALTGWARASGALIVEDDYDGEFRYDVAPLPALFGLDPGVVIYLGTTSKTLTPALRVGWLAAPAAFIPALAQAAEMLGDWAAEPAQSAVLTLITGGDLERHIRRMRHEYTRRRAVLTDAFGDGTLGRLLGDDAGMHMVLELEHDARRVADVAAERGVAVATLDRYYAGPVTTNGLVLGYGGASLADLTRACHTLGGILRERPALPLDLAQREEKAG
jgi:GntR family transcriptional regulator/MocR family aminotransferase